MPDESGIHRQLGVGTSTLRTRLPSMSNSVKKNGVVPTVVDAIHLPSGDVTVRAPAPATSLAIAVGRALLVGDGVATVADAAPPVALGADVLGNGPRHDARRMAPTANASRFTLPSSRARARRGSLGEGLIER
jgi:hypothetical protein